MTPSTTIPSSPDTEKSANICRRQLRWWGLAAVFTLVCAVAPLLLSGKAGSAIWISGMLLMGAVLGTLSHRRPWRWGVLLSFVFLLEAIAIGGVYSFTELLDKLRFGVTLAIPGFIGCYGGAFVRKVRRGRIHLTGEPESIRYWKAAVGFGFAAGVIALITGTAETVPVPSMIVILSAATTISYLKPQRLWRWIVALTPGLPLAVTLLIIVEVSRDPASHTLYPLELGLALLYAIAPAIAGSMLGRVIKTGSLLQPPSDPAVYG